MQLWFKAFRRKNRRKRWTQIKSVLVFKVSLLELGSYVHDKDISAGMVMLRALRDYLKLWNNNGSLSIQLVTKSHNIKSCLENGNVHREMQSIWYDINFLVM